MSAHYDAQYQKKNIIIIIDSQYDSIFDNYNALHTHTHTNASICGNLFYHLYLHISTRIEPVNNAATIPPMICLFKMKAISNNINLNIPFQFGTWGLCL